MEMSGLTSIFRKVMRSIFDIKRGLALLVLFFCCVFGAKAQDNLSGYYYIANYNDYSTNKWYMVPASNGGNNNIWIGNWAYNSNSETPYLTTYRTGADQNSVWEFVKVEGEDYYYIKHLLTGKYVLCHTTSTNVNKAVHLEAVDNPGENAKYAIAYQNGSAATYSIIPKNNTSSFNAYLGNQNHYYYSNGGLIGLYNATDNGSKWYLESAIQPPTISYDYVTNQTTITCETEDASIYYTTDGTEPTSSSTLYESSFAQTTPCTIKAISIKNGCVSEVVTYDLDRVARPNIYGDGDHIVITCSTDDATILYTTDGSDPNPGQVGSGNPTQVYDPDNGLAYQYSGQTIKAMGVKDGMIVSYIRERTVKLRCPTPEIAINPTSGNVSITCSDAGATIYYTTDGTDPTAESTVYDTTNPIALTEAATVKAIAVHTGYYDSFVGSATFGKVATPEIEMSSLYVVTLTCATEDADIYYTTDGSTPDPADAGGSNPTQKYTGTDGTGPFNNNTGGPVKAIAIKTDMVPSDIAETEPFQCAKPIITHIRVDGVDKFRITGGNFPAGVTFTFYYTTDGTDPTTSSTQYDPNNPVDFTGTITVKAIAVAEGYNNSEVSEKTMSNDFTGGSGQENDPYLIGSDADFDLFVILCNNGSADDHYKLVADVNVAGSESVTEPFTGSFVGSYDDATGNYYTISNLDHPLVNTVSGGTVRNVIFDNLNISGGDADGDAGAVANKATGASRIYNCGVLATVGSSVSGSRRVGSIVGFLDGTSRVINCFSFADITGGSDKGGIVGYNNFASTTNDLRTMVMNCMFYGNITTGGNISPVYGGSKINNVSNINNFNYFCVQSSYFSSINKYNCALAAEDRYLTRFEFHRLMLNSNRELAVFYVDPNPTTFTQGSNTIYRYHTELMAKWVVDKSMAPYPILKAPSTAESPRFYSSVINYDSVYTYIDNEIHERDTITIRNHGGQLGTLSITIQDPDGSGKPEGASLTTTNLTLPIIDKDTASYNFNYYKVQLPYYNSVGTKNYTQNKVVTGWKIVAVTSSASIAYNSFETGVDAPAYNFADRNSYDKDMYSVSGRVFSQGAYYDVPVGVTAITIEPYWGKAVYVSDPYFDKTYNNGYVSQNYTPAGMRYVNGQTYTINGDQQKVYTSTSNAISALNSDASKTVYDYAVVLVGNYHQLYGGSSFTGNNNKPLTVMSADLDFDNEPDYSFVYQHGNSRVEVAPLRFDFLNYPGIGMMQKTEGVRSPEVGIFWTNGWFEVTNTCVVHFREIEYNDHKDIDAPFILLGGECEQIVSKQDGGAGAWHTTYLHFGSNVWFKEFQNGTHINNTHQTPHRPISVTGGEYEKFYLSGVFRPDVNPVQDNAECYVNGGRFGEMAGAGMEIINGDVTWKINHADIEQFYGGGINAQKPITGNINVTIDSSYVRLYCGGPKFGDMTEGKTVTTHATGSIFGHYYGAGYGGTSLYRELAIEDRNVLSGNGEQKWNTYANDYYLRVFANSKGISTSYEYEYFRWAGSGNSDLVGRFYINYASLSLSTTHTVNSTLLGCEVMDDYYGGGCLGYVDGDVYSTLTDCTIHGNVFGGGYSAAIPTVDVMEKELFQTVPHYNINAGVFEPAVFPPSYTYSWYQVEDSHDLTSQAFDETNKYIYTKVDMTHLGQVEGDTYVNVNGKTIVEGMLDGIPEGGVFGAGNASAVLGNATVVINTDNTDEQYAINNVYGGGNTAVTGNSEDNTGGDTFVTIEQGLIGKMVNGDVMDETGNVFGGGKGSPDNKHLGDVLGNATVTLEDGGFVRANIYGGSKISNVGQTRVGTSADGAEYVGIEIPVENTGHCIVNMTGGEVGYQRTIEQIEENPEICCIYGSGMGDPDEAYNTWTNVNSTQVNVTGGHVWGNVHGGGEEGHVLGNASVHVGGTALIGNGSASDGVDGIGGMSSADGNVYGGGRGFRALALTAGGVGGNTSLGIDGNAVVLGSIYGGGRMGSVGIFFCSSDDSRYGSMQPGESHGYTTVEVGGNARIGTEHKNTETTGHVYGGGKGGVFFEGISPIWPYIAQAKGTAVTVNGAATVYGNVYGGAEQARILEDTEVSIEGDAEIGSTDTSLPTNNDSDGEPHYRHFGSVFGGGQGYGGEGYDDDTNMENEPVAKISGLVMGNCVVNLNGGHVYDCVFGGGSIASVGQFDEDGQFIEGTGLTTVNVDGGEVGPLDWSGLNAYVYGASQGVEYDPSSNFKAYCNVHESVVNVNNTNAENPTKIWGSIFGGGSDGHVFGDVEVHVEDVAGNLEVGTDGTTSWDGNIFGGGRNYLASNKSSGRVGGNISVDVKSGTMLGSVFGGGRMASTGVDENGEFFTSDYDDHGHITVSISGGTIGWDIDPSNPYDPQAEGSEYVGNVFGGAKGKKDLDFADFGKSVTSDVSISNDAYVWGNVYGGGELGNVKDSTNVIIEGDAVVRLRAFAGGKGYLEVDEGNYYTNFKNAGDVGELAQGSTPKHGLARITLDDNANVGVCLYGGAQNANVHGNAYVLLNGGSVGRNRSFDEIKDESRHCHVFGGGQGNPLNGAFNTWTNIDTAYVNIKPGSRVFGSVFGGGEDGHVLGNTYVDVNLGANDSIGTLGYTIYDGNIFGGGRGFEAVSPTAGGTGGNTDVNVYGSGKVLGCVYGGGEVASVGIIFDDDVPPGGDTVAGHCGYTKVHVYGDVTIGHDQTGNSVIDDDPEYYIGYTGGNVFGGGMGDDFDPNVTDEEIVEDPLLMQGRMAHVKQTEVVVDGNVFVRGGVFGGGEAGRVWNDTKVTIGGDCTIGMDRAGEDHIELEKLVHSGSVYGGSWGSASLEYADVGRVYGNTEVTIQGTPNITNNIYGGGEYASVGTLENGTAKSGTGHTLVTMKGGELGPLDMSGLNAYVYGGGKGVGNDVENAKKDFGNVFNTNVLIQDGARIYGSVFGGGEDGHVRGNAITEVSGGVIGTTGLTTWDGNIFGGGRNYSASNLAAGRVGGNDTVIITGGNMYGSIYGGGRLASVGVDENGDAYLHDVELHGHTYVSIEGGVVGYPVEGQCETDAIRGNVFGGCKGNVIKPTPTSVEPALISNVITTQVIIKDGATIKGSVFGGGEDGHVLSNTNVTIEGGTIGDDETNCSNIHHGSVYGGGRGIGQDAEGHYSGTAGTVKGNALVTITGGHINRNVYGGGFVASVGTRGENFGDPDPNTGWARVKISGGTIGTNSNVDNKHGNVFGSCRGVAGDEYQNFSYVNNALVTLSSGNEVVKGSVFGSGEDGHVLINTQVTINGGQVGVAGNKNSYKGNVYGGGRGIDLDGTSHLSPTAGLVKGNSKVSVQSGIVYGNVYGGGNASSVWGDKLVDVLTTANSTSPTIHGDVYGGCRAVPNDVALEGLNKGLKTVNVRDGHIMGDVYGCSYSSIDGDPATGHEKDWTSFVNIDGGQIDGNVYGAGWDSEVKGSVCVNIGANAIAYQDGGETLPRNAANVRFDDSGGIPIVTFGHVRDIDTDNGKATFTGFLVDEGAPRQGTRELGFCWSTTEHPTIADNKVSESFEIGDVGNYTLEATGLTPDETYYVRAYATNPTGTAYSPEVQFTMDVNGSSVLATNQPDAEYPTYEPTADNKILNIKGSVYAGSDYYASHGTHLNDWLLYYGISGYSNVYIDGTDYNTTASSESTPGYMNIGGGLYGSSTHCESGQSGRNILLRNYGTRTVTGDGQLTSSTRTLTTIQRCGNLLLDNANVNITGSDDLNVESGNTGHYGVLKVDTVFYLANASSLNLSYATATPANMDSIRCLRSVHLKSGSVYDQQFFGKLPWEWIGISGDTEETAKMYYTETAPSTSLSKNQENVILFNNESRLWVRYCVGTSTMFGELQGFIRMDSPFQPYGMETFAYARPKIIETTAQVNEVDGGFLSYKTEYNFFTDMGQVYTNTKQYPYTNVLQIEGKSAQDRLDYRQWNIPRFNGTRWYVDGTIGWGRDMTKVNGWGLSPDKPKKTIFGESVAGNNEKTGGIVTEIMTSELNLNYSYKDDGIFVVGALSPADEAAILHDSVNGGVYNSEYPLKLYRYPGGHPLSWATSHENEFYYDLGGGTPASPNEGLSYDAGDPKRYQGPGAYYGPFITLGSSDTKTFEGVEMDGLYGHNAAEDLVYMIPGSGWQPTAPDGGWVTSPSGGSTIDPFVETNVTAPLVIANAGSTLNLQGGTELKRGYNNNDAANLGTEGTPKYNYYLNADFDNSVVNGGGLYVDERATVNVEGMVSIASNYQKKGSNAILSNVYLSTFGTHLNITDAVSEATRIGITSPIRNREANYTYNTFSPIAVATNSADALSAWQNENFSDDLNWFFVNGHSNETPRTSYYSETIADYPSTGFTPANTLYFGWTWNNVVRMQPEGFSASDIDSPEDLAWLISQVNGLNGQTASNLSGSNFQQTEDIDLQQYVWLPIGASITGTMRFAGQYEGRGHLIENLSIDYIGKGDRRYERTNYGLFGAMENASINRTFAVSGLIRPVGDATMGGLVGLMQGANAVVSNSESAVTLYCPSSTTTQTAAGGLVGVMMDGEIHSSMAMSEIHATNYQYIGGLIGCSGDINGSYVGTPEVKNSFANMKLTLGSSNSVVAMGGLIGYNRNADVRNSYAELQSGSTTPAIGNFAALVGDNQSTVDHCYGFKSYDNCSYDLTKRAGVSSDPNLSNSYKYAPVIGADQLGYMFYDNLITIDEEQVALSRKLNQWVKANNSDNKYAYWTRPTLTEINGDYPVLLLSNYKGTDIGAGDFRCLATYNNGAALQYGGTVRDNHQLSSMLAREESIFIYGDVDEDLASATVSANKISIYEHAAILHPGSLSSFNNTYVGISFDNSSNGAGTSTVSVNEGLLPMGPNELPRDWHMFSSPLSDAPLGFNYNLNGTNTNTAAYNGGDQGSYYNNIWTNREMEFSWLNDNQPGDKRYWMYGWDNSLSQQNGSATINTTSWRDGYFPSQVEGVFEFGQGCIEGTDEEGRYPYGMDLLTWNEPHYHWINFKRNGPNHWHSDVNEETGNHDHLDYVPVEGATANQNEDNLIVGRGYMASICDSTFLQSHGSLNAGNELGITLTKKGKNLSGWNLVGNPYHAYLDFTQFATANTAMLSQQEGMPFYVVYDADGYTNYPESAFLYYPATGSVGGTYAGRYLHPHQGFYVLAVNAGKITFNEDMTVTRSELTESNPDLDGHFRDWEPAYPLVNLYLSSEQGCSDVTVIEFERPEWGGARKMKELRVGNGVFYAQHNDTHYAALFAKQGTERVPLWFEAKEDDTYTIKWNTANGDFHSMYLVDNLTGVRYDMIENDSYTFQGHVGDYPSRFYITFNVTDIEENVDDSENIFAFFDGSQWMVTGEGELEFIDLHGRVLWRTQLNGGQSRVGLPNVSSGMYMFRLTNGQGCKVQKVIVNK